MAFDDTLLKVTENGLEGIFCHLNEESNLSKRSVVKLKTIGKFPKQRQVIGACVDGSEELCLSLVDESKQCLLRRFMHFLNIAKFVILKNYCSLTIFLKAQS